MAEIILVGLLVAVAFGFFCLWLLGLWAEGLNGPPASHFPAYIALAAVVAAFVFTFT